MSETLTTDIFPLPLAVWERYMLADDRPAYPMVFTGEMLFYGKVDRAAFECALDETLLRHPLLHAVVDLDRKSGRQAYWIRAACPRAPITWAQDTDPCNWPEGEAMDLRRQGGLRLCVRQGAERSTVTVQFHHACTDGIGAAEFLGDLLATYGIRTASGSECPRLMPLDPHRLRARNQFKIEATAPVSRGKRVRATLHEAVKWFGRRPTPLDPLPGKRSGAPPATFPAMCLHTFDETQTRALRSAAVRQKVSLNDLLLCEVFVTLRDWNRHARPGRPEGWLRINMPTALRGPQHNGMPAANVMSHTFLTRRTTECDNPNRLLEGICWETGQIKQWRLGLHFLGSLALAAKIPGGLPLAIALGAGVAAPPRSLPTRAISPADSPLDFPVVRGG